MRGKGFFGQTRRERRAYPAVDLEGASNEVWPKKNCRPEGCAEFGLWLRCSSVTDPLRGMLEASAEAPRALPQAKLGATHVSIIKCHSTRNAPRELPVPADALWHIHPPIRSNPGVTRVVRDETL